MSCSQTAKRSNIDEIWSNDYQYRKGRSRDALFGLESLGFFANEGDIAASPGPRVRGSENPEISSIKDQKQRRES
ncbi:MAG: hypothetical protein AB2L24_24240 [Mangrovibacterium sp.]